MTAVLTTMTDYFNMQKQLMFNGDYLHHLFIVRWCYLMMNDVTLVKLKKTEQLISFTHSFF